MNNIDQDKIASVGQAEQNPHSDRIQTSTDAKTWAARRLKKSALAPFKGGSND